MSSLPDKTPAQGFSNEKRSLGKSVFKKCGGCGSVLTAEALSDTWHVCSGCGYHHPMTPADWRRLLLDGGGAVDFAPVGSPQVLTCVAGACHLVCDGDAERLAPGGTVIVPAGAGGTLASADGVTVMRGWVPDLWRDVVGPARAAGHPDAAIAELAGELDDVRSALGPTPEPFGGRC